MARKIKLLNGYIYPVDRCGAMDDVLQLRVTEGTLTGLVTEFGDPQNTQTIEHWYDDTETDHVFFTGYTALTAASQDIYGVTMTLRKDE